MLNAINKSLSVTRNHSAIPLSPFASKQMSSAMQVLGSGPAPSTSLLTNPCSFVNAYSLLQRLSAYTNVEGFFESRRDPETDPLVLWMSG
jgi:hypothetical protein